MGRPTAVVLGTAVGFGSGIGGVRYQLACNGGSTTPAHEHRSFGHRSRPRSFTLKKEPQGGPIIVVALNGTATRASSAPVSVTNLAHNPHPL